MAVTTRTLWKLKPQPLFLPRLITATGGPNQHPKPLSLPNAP